MELNWKKKLLTVDDYVEKCKPIGQYILKELPESLVAATAEGYLKRGHAMQWNKALNKCNEEGKFFNAVVIHKYLYVPEKIANLSLDEKIDYLFAGVSQEVKNSINVGREYFNGLPILPTEIGICLLYTSPSPRDS